MSYRSVTIVVVEGKDLKPVDHGSADPYVNVSIGEKKLSAVTPSLRKTVNPVWNCKIVLGKWLSGNA